jgi:hypothetical protein
MLGITGGYFRLPQFSEPLCGFNREKAFASFSVHLFESAPGHVRANLGNPTVWKRLNPFKAWKALLSGYINKYREYREIGKMGKYSGKSSINDGNHNIPPGKLTVCYWKLPFIVDLPINDFP